MSHYKIQKANYSLLDKNISIAIITSEFNKNYTHQLEEGNKDFLYKEGFKNITTYQVPGAFEIPGMAKQILDTGSFDLIICLGVVIKGDTPHFDYVCSESTRGIMDLTIQSKIPIINGILTCYNDEQVLQRIQPVYALSGLNTLIAYKKLS